MPPPLRVAVVGAGPAGFYAAEALLRDERVTVDVFDRLPTPFGLVRTGVAPDHQRIKNVTRVFERVAESPRFRFFGGVTYGDDLGFADLARHYHQLLFATGAQTDRRLGIPGEDLARSYPATAFVAWYNGHPDLCTATFDLAHERAVVVGVGNVAVDVARILVRDPDELATTDIADHALEALRRSRVREVVLLGRRGPAQAAFTYPELRELAELPSAELVVRPDEVRLDPLSRAALEAAPDRQIERILELLEEVAARPPSGKPRRIVLRFLVSPTELLDDGRGGVGAVRLVRNALVADQAGGLRARATGVTEVLPAGLVFRSIGYRGLPLPGLPFDERTGTVPNRSGRVEGVTGAYVAGWIKRGPTGVIGTNKPDAQETVAAMREDADAGRTLRPEDPSPEGAEVTIRARQPQVFTYAAWRRLDAHEVALGERTGRPRVKLTSVEAMRDVLRADAERLGR